MALLHDSSDRTSPFRSYIAVLRLMFYWTIVIAVLIRDRSVEIDVLLDNSYCCANSRSLCGD
ncbi:MAG: hypothetical protein F6K23_02735 [Okeania sp. SIO2C9]|uniref:hypothetical protein n=1 Tax=Okeania sp. SIO2C9 TaxID=2607791 RepID=UPI0013C10D99|nr:hypothetical protein [Okeania sp. SIO2C9]NEQ72087.1 hypothetical protein [Okeania sp. SIO2C9]